MVEKIQGVKVGGKSTKNVHTKRKKLNRMKIIGKDGKQFFFVQSKGGKMHRNEEDFFFSFSAEIAI